LRIDDLTPHLADHDAVISCLGQRFRNGQHALTGRHDRYARGDASHLILADAWDRLHSSGRELDPDAGRSRRRLPADDSLHGQRRLVAGAHTTRPQRLRGRAAEQDPEQGERRPLPCLRAQRPRAVFPTLRSQKLRTPEIAAGGRHRCDGDRLPLRISAGALGRSPCQANSLDSHSLSICVGPSCSGLGGRGALDPPHPLPSRGVIPRMN